MYEEFREVAAATGLAELIERVETGYSERSPSGGIHWLYRSTVNLGNMKLARRPKCSGEKKHPNDNIKTLIETRGASGFIIVSPSYGAVHPTGKPYELLRGGFDTIITISIEERESLVELARSFDQMPKTVEDGGPATSDKSSGRPGDYFNLRADWQDLLGPLGWRLAYQRNGTGYWSRPGKEYGVSATTNFRHSDLLYVFSTSTRLSPERGYSKFAAYAELEHNGDYSAAARTLSEQGYGDSGSHPGRGSSKNPSQATLLVDLAADLELWHTPDEEGFATIQIGEHLENWPIRSSGFKRYLGRRFYLEHGKTPNAQALNDALNVLGGQAMYSGPEHPVFTRMAEQQGVLYVDLTDSDWHVVEITPTGWQVIADPPVKFRRSRGMLPLPHPKHGGNINELGSFVNIADGYDLVLLISWLHAAYRPRGPYPILILHGEQGSAKSTLARTLRALVDPNRAALRSTPKDPRDLMIAATNGWCLAFDNISWLSPWMSDALCRLATGGGFATRELYTDAEETLFDAQRPVILNGIEEIASRGDLLDRSIILYLPSISDQTRCLEAVFWNDFELARPRIIGAVLDAVSTALQNEPQVSLPDLPRMADFAQWSVAGAPAFGWNSEIFTRAYAMNGASAHELALEGSPILPRLMEFVQYQGQWSGTASALLKRLTPSWQEDQQITKSSSWPKTPRALSNALRRLAPNLKVVGLEITFERTPGNNSVRQIIIKKVGKS